MDWPARQVGQPVLPHVNPHSLFNISLLTSRNEPFRILFDPFSSCRKNGSLTINRFRKIRKTRGKKCSCIHYFVHVLQSGWKHALYTTFALFCTHIFKAWWIDISLTINMNHQRKKKCFLFYFISFLPFFFNQKF